MDIFYENLEERLFSLLEDSKHLVSLYSPYLKKSIAQEIIDKTRGKAQIQFITSWRPSNFTAGASDLEVYEICKSNKVPLYVNNNLHLKTYLFDELKVLTGSANLTKRGLGAVPNSNIETLVYCDENLDDYLLFLKKVILKSTLACDETYEKLRDCVNKMLVDFPRDANKWDDEMDRFLDKRENYFLISALPMSLSPETLYREVKEFNEKKTGLSPEAIHDYILFSINEIHTDNIDEFLKELSMAFFSHPFIEELCEFICQSRRFGEIKEWVQKKCTDVPVPSRRELTGNVRVLYEWLKILGKGKYEYSRPAHSEILKPIGKRRIDEN